MAHLDRHRELPYTPGKAQSPHWSVFPNPLIIGQGTTRGIWDHSRYGFLNMKLLKAKYFEVIIARHFTASFVAGRLSHTIGVSSAQCTSLVHISGS
ncbi:hypothetical protein VKT23_016002 [Stygiomarasmius scandens]|uniref:Uncharacterized protein n=1 Tax=Marasmiellus scandens TaxID=2682957 RepID=A0ABR1IYD7_9AGAR